MKSLSREVYRLCRTTREDVFEKKGTKDKEVFARSILAYCLFKFTVDTATISFMLGLSQTSTYHAIRRIESWKEIRDKKTIDILTKLNKLFGYDF